MARPCQLGVQGCSCNHCPAPVIVAFVAGEERFATEHRSIRRLHDTVGEVVFLLRATSPLAMRRVAGAEVRIDALHSISSRTDALLTDACESAGAGLRYVTEWQLVNGLRSRSMPCDV